MTRIRPEEAQGAATDFLLDHIGNQTHAGEPMAMLTAFRSIWIVPIELTYLRVGSIGVIGYVAVDDETALVVGWTPIDVMKKTAVDLNQRRKLEIEELDRAK